MAIDKDPGKGAFPVDRPTEALKRDHDMVRALSDRYLNGDSQEVKVQAGKQILQALHMHSRIEESVFYPAVRCIDEALVRGFERDHDKVDNLLATLDGMSLADAHSDALMRELISAVTAHIQEEENQLFPRIEGSGVDMTSVGLEMQSFEANMVHTQAQMSDQGRMRR
ncbi:hemerythrin domain-containing protein [Massilia sp. IC2-477]|uniref:hemerythrin domain-containing protein n=1 Tax=Massilia sp. IC2-477 TaxID=2887198 RepID=UPI001D11913F|nr:hemerythrin domain-containing protein [Massilia sp. IC2-477]MCC2958701.1 hemerythrin domain-containing protein [Massilia sp. IC2-477]